MNSTYTVGHLIQQLINNRIGRNIVTLLFTIFQLTSCVEDKVDPLLIGSIKGVIVSKALNTPIEEVEVNTAPVTSMTFTDADGKFTIDNVPEGEYTILTNAEGYARETIKVKVIRNAATEVSIKLGTANILAPAPETPVPANGETNQPLTVTLKWSIPHTSDDTLQYAINIYEANQIVPLIEIEGIRDTLYVVENLKYNTAYYWQVEVQSSTGYITSGDLWLFKTIPFPDNHIIFTSKNGGNFDLYSSDLAGDSLTRITFSSSYELRPIFNSNRDKIAFSSNATLDYHIYTMNNDGSGIQRITTIPLAGYHNQGIGFSWSPDNGKFIYSNYNKLYRIDKDGVNLTLIATAPTNRNFRACDWTAVDNKIVVETIGSTIYESEIYLMNADGSDTVRLVDNLPGIIESPSFSIDGKEILYTRDASGFESEDGRQLDSRIFIKNTGTMAIVDVSNGKPDGTNDLQPRFSPDGAKIIFVNVSNTPNSLKSVWIMDKDGANREKLFDGAEMPNWK